MKRKLSKIYTYKELIIIILLLAIPFISHSSEIIATPENPAIVIDGDSLEIGNERIRLIGIDAPEYDQTCKDKKKKKYACGKASKNFLEKLIENKKVRCIVHKEDKYKRNLCTCFADDIDINKELILNGHAVSYLETNYKEEEKYARKNHLGLWNGYFQRPRLFRIWKQNLEKNKK